MIKRVVSISKTLLAISMLVLLAGCAGSKSVPFTIQSDPLGGHIAMQVVSSEKDSSADWIYLGKTPIDVKRQISNRQLKKAEAFRIKVFKNGFHDQIRDWNGDEIKAEIEERGSVYWNPKLVPVGG